MQDKPVHNVETAISPEVTVNYANPVQDAMGYDGSTSFYVTFAAPPKGAHGVRSFKFTVEEVDHDDMPPHPSVIDAIHDELGG